MNSCLYCACGARLRHGGVEGANSERQTSSVCGCSCQSLEGSTPSASPIRERRAEALRTFAVMSLPLRGAKGGIIASARHGYLIAVDRVARAPLKRGWE